MCGIAGIITDGNVPRVSDSLARMIGIQSHRGPDGNGSWVGQFGAQLVGIGSNRLAILDLDMRARQPFVSDDGNCVLAFNGELYNYIELRNELQGLGAQFKTRGDTEVVLHSLRLWGEAALDRFNGMWALAWLDRIKRRLILSRDRLGEKPLYYSRRAHSFFFSSEIKAILAGSDQRFSVNPVVVSRYLQQSLLDAQEETFFEGIQVVPAGHNVILDLTGAPVVPVPRSSRFWAPGHDVAEQRGLPDLMDQVRETFIDAVSIRLRSDVRVGALLSGGIGSSSIACAMRLVLGKDANLHLISAVNEDPRFSEEPFIDHMAGYLNCPTTKVSWRPSGREAFRLLEEVTFFNDEPVGDFTTVYHYILMDRAKELGIKVVMSGQGDDELLCGYRKFLGFHIQTLVRTGKWHTAARTLADFVGRGTIVSQFNLADARRYLPKTFQMQHSDVRGPLLRDTEYQMEVGLGEGDLISRQIADLLTFSIPTQCHYEDRMSMALSREIRLPFLDHRLVDLLVPLAPDLKLRGGWTKWIFRKAMEHHMPPRITWRKDKMGFDNPQSHWLRNEFRDEVQALLSGDLLIETSGLVDRSKLQGVFDAYCAQRVGGGIRYQDFLQPIALEFWLRRFEQNLSRDGLGYGRGESAVSEGGRSIGALSH